jgi:hypothetical protein
MAGRDLKHPQTRSWIKCSEASVFAIADVGLVGDVFKVAPELQTALYNYSGFDFAAERAGFPQLFRMQRHRIDQRPGTRQQVREARRVRVAVSPLRAEQVPLWKNTIGISQLVVSQLVAVWV